MDSGFIFNPQTAEPLVGMSLLSIRQMAAKSNLTTGHFYCGRSLGTLKLKWVEFDKAVFATEDSFITWMAERAARKQARVDRKAAKMAKVGV
jgi:hypothetical protein